MLPPRFLLRILLVFPVLVLGTMSCATTAIVDLDKVSIEQIINSPAEFEGKPVIVTGRHSWKHVENAYDPRSPQLTGLSRTTQAGFMSPA